MSLIPYEKQSDAGGIRSCGAACLSMVYAALGQPVPQATVWPAIAKPNRAGLLSSTTYLMAQDALNRGFHAVAFQARHPLQILRLCQATGAHAILNHRGSAESPAGHYSVLVGVTEQHVVLHDPFYGPSHQVPHAELLELWQPRFAESEIAGQVLIAIAAPKPVSARACEFCHVPFPAGAPCPRCNKPVVLLPDEPLGCANSACIAKMWNYICCPNCDQAFTFTVEMPAPGAAASPPPQTDSPAAAAPAPPADPLNFEKMFSEIDKFCTQILAIPGMAEHAEIRKHLDQVKAGKEKLTLARAEALARQETANRDLAKHEERLKQSRQAHRKKMEELAAQAPPLDGNALGRALLKRVGFMD